MIAKGIWKQSTKWLHSSAGELTGKTEYLRNPIKPYCESTCAAAPLSPEGRDIQAVMVKVNH